MKQNFTVIQGALEGVAAFLNVARSTAVFAEQPRSSGWLHRRSAAEAIGARRLVRVLERFASTAPGMFLCYPGRRQILPKLLAFIDHLKSRSCTSIDAGRHSLRCRRPQRLTK
jgi:DNA-binding transcriptional LysR family regulator